MNYQDVYREWVEYSELDFNIKNQLLSIKNNEKEKEERFYKHLDFGTGGLRALMGAGTNYLNKYTIKRITKGYANYLLNEKGAQAQDRGVVIAYDNRHYSKKFAVAAAVSLAEKGIKTYIFEKITSTPELSFSVKHLNAIGGIVITASHNPPEYNGYKIYDETGCQVTTKSASAIIREVNKIKNYLDKECISENSALINWIGEEVNDAFLTAEIANLKQLDIVRKISNKFKVLYTPLHGAGKQMIFKGLKEMGFQNIFTVEEQLNEDPNFSTVNSPNPENPSAFSRAINIAKENDIDIIIGTDPDADRMGAMVKNQSNNYEIITGNQIGALFVHYLLTTDEDLLEKNNPYIANTIVTSDLGKKIAEKYNVRTVTTLTGFKFIGEQINLLEKNNNFIMGYEESYGYLTGTHARDKDGVGAAMLLTEMAAYYSYHNKSLIDVLFEIYEEFGYHQEKLISVTLPGKEGKEKITDLMNEIRTYGIKELGDYSTIIKTEDFNSISSKMPKSNLIKFMLSNDSWIAIRPSGTEPKIKFYIGVNSTDMETSLLKLLKLESIVSSITDTL